MSGSAGRTPALSPVLLLGFALRPAPRPALQVAASLAVSALLRRHRSVFERLDGLANPDFVIDPLDLPFRFHLHTALPSPRLVVLREDQEPDTPPAAMIRGSLPALVDLLEGRIDGDALFFSRSLSVEGDMAAVVALRNAVDGADIALFEDVLAALGPVAGPLRGVLRAGGSLYRRAEQDLEALRGALLAPVVRRCDAQDARLREIDEALAARPARHRERQA